MRMPIPPPMGIFVGFLPLGGGGGGPAAFINTGTMIRREQSRINGIAFLILNELFRKVSYKCKYTLNIIPIKWIELPCNSDLFGNHLVICKNFYQINTVRMILEVNGVLTIPDILILKFIDRLSKRINY